MRENKAQKEERLAREAQEAQEALQAQQALGVLEAQANKDNTNEDSTPDNTEVKTETEPTNEVPVPVLLSSGKWAVGPTTMITCVDCGKERLIKIQDAFQVTRCAACQKKAQNKRRNEKKKAKNKEASRERRIAEARALLAEVEAEARAEGQE